MEILIEYEDAITPKQQANNNLDSFHNAVGPGYIDRDTNFSEIITY